MKKRPTKKQRHLLYKSALYQYTESPFKGLVGLCVSIRNCEYYREMKYIFPDPYHSLSSYPEIYKHKPEVLYNEHYWWNPNNTVERTNVLIQAIKETES